MIKFPIRWCASSIVAVRLLGAADLQVWNTTEFTLLEKNGVRLRGFGVVRARNHFADAYDNRLGGEASYRFTPRLRFSGGYLSRWVDPDGSGTHRENRFFAGPAILLTHAPIRLEAATRYERYVGVYGKPDFNQYKQSIEIERRRKALSPFLAQQFTFRSEGFQRSRSVAGLRWRSESGRELEIGYQFESYRSGSAWIPRHSVRTGVDLGKVFGRR